MKNSLICLLAIFASSLSQAATAPTETSVSEYDSLSWKNVDLSYALLLKGSTVEHVDGNANGKGTNLNLRHYQNFYYNLSEGWSFDAGSQFRQYFRPADPKNPKRSDFEWRDPFVGVSKKDVWRRGDQAVSAKARYYIPASEYNVQNRKKEYDEGNGSLQLGAQYQNRFADDRLTFKFPLEFNRRFPAKFHKVQQDYWLGSRPSLSCKTSRSTSARVEYYTGDLNHRSTGRWTRLNEPAIGHTAAAALDWFPMKDLLVSPQVTWGRENFRFNAAELSLFANYLFL